MLKAESDGPDDSETGLEQSSPVKRNLEEDVLRINEERWPNVNGVYDAQGEWHDWNDFTYSYSYENSELIILPYTVCTIHLSGPTLEQPV